MSDLNSIRKVVVEALNGEDEIRKKAREACDRLDEAEGEIFRLHGLAHALKIVVNHAEEHGFRRVDGGWSLEGEHVMDAIRATSDEIADRFTAHRRELEEIRLTLWGGWRNGG